MIDIHSHILYGLDDGAKDLEMTLEMLKIAEKDGITTIVATPHYVVGANQYSMEVLKNRYLEVKNLIKEHHINIKLLLGNELFLDEYILQALKEEACCGVGDTSYLLLELPMSGAPLYTEKVLYDLIQRGYRPILAHPERYVDIQQHPNKLIDYIKIGCITQINSSSIDGTGGEKAQETAKLLLENNMGHLVATDCHSNRRRQPRLSKAYNQMVGWMGKEKTDRLFFRNPERVLQNEEIEIEEPLYIQEKKHFLHRLKGYFSIAK